MFPVNEPDRRRVGRQSLRLAVVGVRVRRTAREMTGHRRQQCVGPPERNGATSAVRGVGRREGKKDLAVVGRSRPGTRRQRADPRRVLRHRRRSTRRPHQRLRPARSVRRPPCQSGRTRHRYHGPPADRTAAGERLVPGRSRPRPRRDGVRQARDDSRGCDDGLRRQEACGREAGENGQRGCGRRGCGRPRLLDSAATPAAATATRPDGTRRPLGSETLDQFSTREREDQCVPLSTLESSTFSGVVRGRIRRPRFFQQQPGHLRRRPPRLADRPVVLQLGLDHPPLGDEHLERLDYPFSCCSRMEDRLRPAGRPPAPGPPPPPHSGLQGGTPSPRCGRCSGRTPGAGRPDRRRAGRPPPVRRRPPPPAAARRPESPAAPSPVPPGTVPGRVPGAPRRRG